MVRRFILVLIAALMPAAEATSWEHRGRDLPLGASPEGAVVVAPGEVFERTTEPLALWEATIPSRVAHPAIMHATLAVFCDAAQKDFAATADIRFSTDRAHWSDWQPMAPRQERPVGPTGEWGGDDGPMPPDLSGATVRFDASLEASREDGRRLWGALAAFSQTDPPWPESARSLCAYVAQTSPEFFAHAMPVVGYVEVRFSIAARLDSVTLTRVYLGTALLLGEYYPSDPRGRAEYDALRRRPWDFTVPSP